MSLDIVGPANAPNAVTVRPPDTRIGTFGASDTWMKDCTSSSANDGTKLQAALFNAILAQVRNVVRGNGNTALSAPVVTENNADDGMMLKAVEQLIQRGQMVYADDTSVSANTITVALSPAAVEYKKGMVVVVKLANTITGASTINVNSLGAISIVRFGGFPSAAGDGTATQILALVYDGTNFQIAWRSGASDLIDTAMTFTVHGTSPDFADLNAAIEYLSKFKITRNGSVILQLRGAASGTATQYVYTQSVVFSHPNSDKITIKGANLIGAIPLDTDFAATGVIATDAASDLTMLRGRYATELRFTASANFVVYGSPQLQNLLVTVDGSAVPALTVNVGFPFTVTCSFHGSGTHGVVCNNAYLVCIGGCLSSSGNAGDGFELQASSIANFSAQMIATANVANGFTVSAGCAIVAGAYVAKENGGTGISVTSGGTASLNAGSKLLNNVGWGIQNIGGFVNAGSATWAGNVSGSAQALYEAGIYVTGASGLGTCSPAVNTVGNGNSYINN